ncbi:Common central domain of tyrosinase [Phytophthora infestans]|uniref:Common central domain of tyrosinase n=1 Tax=Phytophthora infestans TaxID=4787 RepID=A0A8S9UY53_PHYIN|nr:Common central domain of tyrosinase [Phytophthora infestans]
MKLFLILSLALLALVSRLAEAQTCGSRLRKDWDMMTATEKTTYRNAIRAAMDSGAYIKFVEMHTDMMSEREAHRQCMFIYWHRYMLVAFENMLRGQGAAYACVTVPYFNWITASARVTSGACSSIGSCSAIARELGGWTSGTVRTLAINGINNSGRCVNVSPLDRFCQLTSTTGAACARCVPRSDWSTVRVPSSTSYAAVRNQVFSGTNIGQMSPLVEQGCHNNVHANLGSTMGTFASPAEPLFWSHHAMVDLLHVIFHKCRVGTTRLTFAQKASHPVAWTSCARRDSSVAFRPTDVVTMRTGERGINPIQASTDPRVGQFFTGVPNQFAGLMDTRDLGSSSYGYYVSGQVATMYTQCDASPRSRKLAETNSTSHPAMCGVTEDDGYDEDGNDYASQNNYPETDYHGQDDGHQDVVVIDDTGNPIDENTPRDAYVSEDSEKKVVDWYEETLDSMGGDTQENMDDLERQACMFEHVCLGGTMDYTPEFKAIWKVTAPRCKIIVDAILSGDETIKYASWREEMELVFGCPEPSYTNDTSSYYGGSWGSSGSGSWGSSESGSWSSTSTDDVDNSNDTIHFSDVLDDPVTTTDISEPTTDVVEDPVPTTEVVEDPEPITEVVEPTTDVLGDPNVVITSTLDV